MAMAFQRLPRKDSTDMIEYIYYLYILWATPSAASPRPLHSRVADSRHCCKLILAFAGTPSCHLCILVFFFGTLRNITKDTKDEAWCVFWEAASVRTIFISELSVQINWQHDLRYGCQIFQFGQAESQSARQRDSWYCIWQYPHLHSDRHLHSDGQRDSRYCRCYLYFIIPYIIIQYVIITYAIIILYHVLPTHSIGFKYKKHVLIFHTMFILNGLKIWYINLQKSSIFDFQPIGSICVVVKI